MKKLALFLVIFLAFVNSVSAHTGLESSSPQDGDIITEELKQITLTFESKIEQSSTFELKNSSGEAIPVNISLSENQIVGNLTNPLPSGEYQVNWKIVGADGHPIDGNFAFSVNLPAAEAPAEEQVKTQEETQVQLKAEEKEIDAVNEVKDEEIQQSKMPSYVVPTVIGILIVIVIGSFYFIMKRKK